MRVAIVGGGMGGLMAALALRDRGHDPLVLERAARAGGKVHTEHVGAWRIEHGPVGVLDNAPDTAALLQRLGVGTIAASDAARHRFLLRDGALRELPDSPPKLLTTGTFTLSEKWRLAREPFAARAPGGDETVAAFARRRLGASLAEWAFEPMVTGIYAGDWERLSVASVFPKLVELERDHGSLLRGAIAVERERRRAGQAAARLVVPRGGMSALPDALARELRPALHTGTEVRALERTVKPNGASGFRLLTSSGELDADRVMVALPPIEAAALLAPLDAAVADAYRAIPEAGVALVSLGFARGTIAHPLVGFGFLVPRREGARILGVQWMTSTFPDEPQAPAGHVMLRCIFGGAHDPAAVALDDAALIAASRAALRDTMAIAAEPGFAHVVRWSRAIPQYEVGHAERVRTIETRGAALGVFATGAALRGPGVNDVVREAIAAAARAVS
jgi:protoporphyrinogen/coproporphyrinogen III oxidase